MSDSTKRSLFILFNQLLQAYLKLKMSLLHHYLIVYRSNPLSYQLHFNLFNYSNFSDSCYFLKI